MDSVYPLVNGYELTRGRDLDGGFDLVSTKLNVFTCHKHWLVAYYENWACLLLVSQLRLVDIGFGSESKAYAL